MSLHNSCAGNKPVITGGWGSGQAGRGGEGGQTCLPAPVLGFHPPRPPPPFPPLRCLYSLCKRELLHSWKLGSTSKGRPACAPSPPCLPKPQTPQTRSTRCLAGVGKPSSSGCGAAPLGNPLRHRPNRIIRHPPGARPRSAGDRPASVYPLTTPGEPGRRAPAERHPPGHPAAGWATPRLAPR